MKNKKAISNYTIIVWSWLIFTALTLFFFLLFGISLRGCGDKTALQEITGEQTDQHIAELILLNYLRTPVNETATISDLMLLSVDESCVDSFRGDPDRPATCKQEKNVKYDSELLINKSKEILNQTFGLDLWYIEVIHPNFKQNSLVELKSEAKSGPVIFPYNDKAYLSQKCMLRFGVPSKSLVQSNYYPVKQKTTVNATIPDKENKIMFIKLGFCKVV